MITEKEKEILVLLAEGKPQKQVAFAMHCSRENIKRILNELFERFEVANTTELVAFAIILDLITTQKHINRRGRVE